MFAEEEEKGTDGSGSQLGLGGQRPELPGNKENLVRGKEDAITGAQKLGIGVRRGPCGILDWKDAARRQRQNGRTKHGAPVRFHKADRGSEHFVLRGLESHWAERRQGAAGRDAANQEHAEARGTTAEAAPCTGVDEPTVVQALDCPTGKLHGSNRAGGEACQWERQGSSSLWQEGVQPVSTEDVLAVGERRSWAQHRRGGPGARQAGPALDQSHDDLCRCAGVGIKTGKILVRRSMAPKTMSGQSQEQMFFASCPQVEPWGLRQEVGCETLIFPPGSAKAGTADFGRNMRHIMGVRKPKADRRSGRVPTKGGALRGQEEPWPAMSSRSAMRMAMASSPKAIVVRVEKFAARHELEMLAFALRATK